MSSRYKRLWYWRCGADRSKSFACAVRHGRAPARSISRRPIAIEAGWRPRRLTSAPASVDTVAAAPGDLAVQVGPGPSPRARAMSSRYKRLWYWRCGADRSKSFACAVRHGRAPARSISRRPIAIEAGWRPRRLTSAPASVDTVAAFRPWRDFRPSVARGRRGHHRREPRDARPGALLNVRRRLRLDTRIWRREGDSNPRSAV